MILNPLKLAAARRKISGLVEEQEPVSFPGVVKSMGVILDNRNKKALAELKKIKEVLGIKNDDFKVVLFTGNEKIGKEFDAIEFRLRDINLKAEIIKEELKKFAVEGVDLLITFAAETNTAVHLLTAHCKAGIKVGRYQQNQALYDLILQTDGDVSLFSEELLKYLKNIKRL